MAANGYSGYYERVLDKVPYGSQLWWRVYDSIPRNWTCPDFVDG
jgi:hypothetical protein